MFSSPAIVRSGNSAENADKRESSSAPIDLARHDAPASDSSPRRDDGRAVRMPVFLAVVGVLEVAHALEVRGRPPAVTLRRSRRDGQRLLARPIRLGSE
jgi:hypothetical protein